jgi:hypothetical protein
MTGEFEGKDLAEKYEVGELIRRGEIGDFYRGRHMFMDRPGDAADRSARIGSR